VALRQPVRSAAVWQAADVVDISQWCTHLTSPQQDAIVEAANRAVDAGRTPETLERDDFDLPVLRVTVAQWVETLNEGRGFILLRGFPVDELSVEATELAYIGLGMQLGTPVGQDADAALLGHVRDEGVARTDPSVRLYRTRQRQDFHTEDRTSLACSVFRGPSPEAKAASPVRSPSTTRSSVVVGNSSMCCTSPCTGIATTRSRRARTHSSRFPCSATQLALPECSTSAGTSETLSATLGYHS